MTTMADLLNQLGTWLNLPDTRPYEVSAAAAVTTRLDGEEAAWILNVAPPSAGKTEAINILDGVTDGRLNEITTGGLLTWSRGKEPHPVGLLARIRGNALVTFGDLSSLLATSDRGGRDNVFSLLRRAYDGHVTRDVAPPSGGSSNRQLEWSGRLTVVAAVTNIIDQYAAHNDALGARWLYIRHPERGLKSRRAASRAARRAGVRSQREEAQKLATAVINKGRAVIANTAVPEHVADHIEDAVNVTCYGRAVVPRSGYGRREIEDVPTIEEPMRLVRQTHVLARGLYALGYSDADVISIIRRVALDSMPIARLAVLRALTQTGGAGTSQIARTAGLHWYVANRHCEDLTAIGVADNLTEDPDDRDQWVLAGEEGQLIRDVITASDLHEKGGPTPPPPQSRQQSEHTEPTLRANPNGQSSEPADQFDLDPFTA